MKGTLYSRLAQFEGQTNRQLLENEPVRYVFECAARRIAGDDFEDLMQQSFVQFIGEKGLSGYRREDFSRYLVGAIKYAVSKAHRWRSALKRNFEAKRFAYNRSTGELIEPIGDHAELLFNPEDVVQIKATLARNIRGDERQKYVFDVFDGFLNREPQAETARRLGKSPHSVTDALKTMKLALTGKTVRSKVTNAQILAALRECKTKIAAARKVGMNYNYFLTRAAKIEVQ